MKCHQILTGACNPGDKTFGVGSVEGKENNCYFLLILVGQLIFPPPTRSLSKPWCKMVCGDWKPNLGLFISL